LLKKASVLAYYGRENEAFNEIAKAVKIIKDQKENDDALNAAVQRRWRFKLGLDECFDVPFPLDKVHPDDIDYKSLEKDFDNLKVPISTIKLYIENVSPFRISEGSKDHFLNNCIEEFYLQCESKI